MTRMAELIDGNIDKIVPIYGTRVLEIPVARELSRAELFRMLPALLRALAARLRPGARPGQEEIPDWYVANRLRQGFSLQDIVSELFLIGPCIFQLLASERPGEPPEPADVARVYDELQRMSGRAVSLVTAHLLEDEQQEKRYVRLLERLTLAELTEQPGSALPSRLNEILGAILDMTKADAVWFSWRDRGRPGMAARPGTLDVAALAEPIGQLVDSLLQAQPSGLDELSSTVSLALEDDDDPILRRGGLRSLLAAPVAARGNDFGALILGFTELRLFHGRERWRLEAFAGRLALFLEQAWLWQSLRSQNERLHDSEERFRLLVESARDYAIYMLDPGGHVRTWNSGAERIKGYSASEIIGQHFALFYPSEDRAQGKPFRALEQALSEGRYEEEGWRVRKDGSRFWAAVVLTPVFGEAGELRGFCKVTRDYSARRRAEEQLREGDVRLRMAVDSAGIGTWDFCLRSGELILEERCRALSGLPPGCDVNFAAFLGAVHPDDRDRVRHAVMAAHDPTTGGVYGCEYRTISTADGTERWIAAEGKVFFEPAGRPSRFLGAMRDITQQKRAEQALRDSEARLRHAEEAVRIASELAGFATFDCWLQEGEIIFSEQAKRHFGLPKEAAVDYGLFLKGVHPQDRDRVHRAIQTALRPDSGGEYDIEYRTIGIVDRKERWLRVRGKVLFDDQGVPLRFIGGGLDITEHKRIDELRDRLLGMVGHDLRNPLNAIKMASQLLLRELPAEQSRTARIIASGADRMNRMINQLVDFTRARFSGGLAVKREPLDLGQLSRELLTEIELANQGRLLRLQVQGECTGQWDRDLLGEMISNLVVNALLHGSPDTPVDVLVAVEGAEVLWRVHNQGPAIPRDLLPLLFEPFRRGKGTVQRIGRGSAGLGLGLYITKEIVSAHGGTISIQSAEDAGTTVTVHLPRLAPGAAGDEQPTSPPAA